MAKLSNKQMVVSILLKLATIVSVLIGVIISAKASLTVFMGGNRVFMYFTIQSNILIALVLLIELIFMFKNKKLPYFLVVLKYISTISITLTGAVFTFMLVPVLKENAWSLANTLTHAVVPVLSIIDFFIIGVNSNIDKINTIFVLIPPLMYAIYAAICYNLRIEFAENQIYPYFFLDWGNEIGPFCIADHFMYLGTMWWILLLLIMLLIVGILYLLILDLFKKILKRG